MKVIIAGSRHFTDYKTFKAELDTLLLQCYEEGFLLEIDTVVSGGCRGIDKMGEKWAAENHIKCVVFYAKWGKYGKSAGPLRNIEMANYADALIAFWDGKSVGTQNMIEAMQERGKEFHIIQIPELNNGNGQKRLSDFYEK